MAKNDYLFIGCISFNSSHIVWANCKPPSWDWWIWSARYCGWIDEMPDFPPQSITDTPTKFANSIIAF